ncbi:MAG: terminase small subunit, partial [Selenomonadaceae bacterium]|nr:terminase small subunit [Selenomonadaceae bacterium]
MTEKQRRFIDYYLQTANAAESARRAGYSKKTDYSIGERLLRNVEVRKAIEERLKQMESNRLAETREVLEHL